MIGRISALIFWLVGTTCLPISPTFAAAPGVGDRVMPKNASLRFETSRGGHAASRWADKLNIGWPASVSSVNGQWLQIADEGGYTLQGRTPATGWVRKDEVVRINDDEIRLQYTSDITGAERSVSRDPAKLARLYWLRGICWENGSPERSAEPQIALADFESACRLDPSFADAWLRQGRLLVRLDAVGSRPRWERCFRLASDRFMGVGAPTFKGQFPHSQGSKGGASTRMVSRQSAVPGGRPEPIAPGAPAPLPEGWSPLVPPQVYFDLGCAYKALCEAKWRSDGAKSDAASAKTEAAKARAEADAAAAEADTASSMARIAKSEATAAWDTVNIALAKVDLARAKAPGKGAVAIAEAKLRVAEAVKKADDAKILAELAQAAADRATKSVTWAKALADRADRVASSAEDLAARAEATATMAEQELQRCFDRACEYFRGAACVTPFWFHPPATEGDLFLARAKTDFVEDEFNGHPQNALSARDLVHALGLYQKAIRLNADFPEAHRGRAEALWLLGTAPEFKGLETIPRDLLTDLQLRSLLIDNDTRATSGLLDAAYESAKTASFLTSDRDPESLKVRGKIESSRAYRISVNVSIEYLAQARETFKQAMLYSQSTRERHSLNESVFKADRQSFKALAFLAADNDLIVRRLCNKVEKMKPRVEVLYKKLPWLDQNHEKLIRRTVMARRAIEEIGGFCATGELQMPERIAATPYDQPWPAAFATRGELMDRDSRIQSWNRNLDELVKEVGERLDHEDQTSKKKYTSLYDELEQCRHEWSRTLTEDN